jgi:hypothetical protein
MVAHAIYHSLNAPSLTSPIRVLIDPVKPSSEVTIHGSSAIKVLSSLSILSFVMLYSESGIWPNMELPETSKNSMSFMSPRPSGKVERMKLSLILKSRSFRSFVTSDGTDDSINCTTV